MSWFNRQGSLDVVLHEAHRASETLNPKFDEYMKALMSQPCIPLEGVLDRASHWLDYCIRTSHSLTVRIQLGPVCKYCPWFEYVKLPLFFNVRRFNWAQCLPF